MSIRMHVHSLRLSRAGTRGALSGVGTVAGFFCVFLEKRVWYFALLIANAMEFNLRLTKGVIH